MIHYHDWEVVAYKGPHAIQFMSHCTQCGIYLKPPQRTFTMEEISAALAKFLREAALEAFVATGHPELAEGLKVQIIEIHDGTD